MDILINHYLRVFQSDVLFLLECLNYLTMSLLYSVIFPEELIFLIISIYIKSRISSIGHSRITNGSNHTYITTSDGLYCTGDNQYGQLGLKEDISMINTFKKVDESLGHPIFVQCGYNNSYLLTDKALYVCGIHENLFYNNNYGYTVIEEIIPSSVITLQCGASHALLLTTHGLFGKGHNDLGQLGIVSPQSNILQLEEKFTKINFFYSIINISCGKEFSYLLTNNGLYSSGCNQYGQLGQEAISSNCYGFSKVQFTEDVISLSAGQCHVFVLSITGLFCCGSNEFGQLGTDIYDYDYGLDMQAYPNRRNFKKISFFKKKSIISFSCGLTNSIVLTNEGLYGCGANYHYQLSQDQTIFQNKWIRINFNDEPIIYCSFPFRNSFILTEKNLWCRGDNKYGQLGLYDNDLIKDFKQCLLKV